MHLLLLGLLAAAPWRLFAALHLSVEASLAWPSRVATGVLRNLKLAEFQAEVAALRLVDFCAYRSKENAVETWMERRYE